MAGAAEFCGTVIERLGPTICSILTRVERMYLSNTTLFMVEVYIVLLRKVQLHVSAFDNGHLQVVHEILSKQLYWIYMGCIQWGGRRRVGHEISYVS